MILLYSTLLIFLVTAKFLIDRRAARLEKKHSQTASAADALIVPSAPKETPRAEPLTIAGIPVAVAKRTQVRSDPGPSKADLEDTAKRQLQLGLLVQKRDRLEEKHLAWAARSESVGRAVARVRAWKGKKLPYTMGVADVSTAMYLVDHYGVNQYVNFQQLTELVSRYITG